MQHISTSGNSSNLSLPLSPSFSSLLYSDIEMESIRSPTAAYGKKQISYSFFWKRCALVAAMCCFLLVLFTFYEVPADVSKLRSSISAKTITQNLMPSTKKVKIGEHWNRTDLKCSIVYAKVPKTASSTFGGITRRIASNHSPSKNKTESKAELVFKYKGINNDSQMLKYTARDCIVFANHNPKPNEILRVLKKKLHSRVLLYGSIRRPDSRAMSEYFHLQVSRKHKSGKEAAVLRYMNAHYDKRKMTNWLGGMIPDCFKTEKLLKPIDCVEKILRYYDLLLIVERLKESLIVLKLLVGLTFSDILFVGGSKINGGYDDYGYKIAKTVRTAKIDDFFKAAGDPRKNLDALLFQEANKMMDRTIQYLGSERVAEEVRVYELILQAVESYCEGRVFFPYDKNGVKQKQISKADCYWNDNGCGVPCMDEFIATDEYHRLVSSVREVEKL